MKKRHSKTIRERKPQHLNLMRYNITISMIHNWFDNLRVFRAKMLIIKEVEEEEELVEDTFLLQTVPLSYIYVSFISGPTHQLNILIVLNTNNCFFSSEILKGVSSLFRQVYIPTGLYSDRYIFRQVYIPTDRYSDSSLM